ncbi:Transforming acidic coiled-coil-containing protein 2 [Varanus komodoensis]|nr:Transforming acidic coiled-coil-containing protein 2 [Varanus komodoensis]
MPLFSNSFVVSTVLSLNGLSLLCANLSHDKTNGYYHKNEKLFRGWMVEDVMSVCSLFDTFRVKKSPKRSPLSDAPSQESTPLPTAETPSVVSTVVHATDEEKLASSVGNQKWTCMTVDLDADKQDYPQPSDLSTFVNETKFISPTEELEYGNSYEIEYMEKIGSSIPQDDGSQTKQSLYLMFDAQQESPVKCPPVRLSDSTTPCSGSSLEETETQLPSGMKLQHPASRSLAASQEPSLQASDKSKAKELVPMALGTASNTIDITTSDDPFVSADALLSRISHPPSVCDQLQYLEPDLAEKNPPVFAQKLQRDPAVSADVSIPKSALYSSRIGSSEGENTSGLLYHQQDLDSALRVAREEIVAKEREISEWKEKYEDSRREVLEMRKIVSEYEKTIAQMIEDEQREKSMSHHTVQQLLIEKEQALADLNSVEKSLADLFRRYEKMKEVLEGFRKNEEVLKKCAQEYLSRVKKEEQRYHALKIHAEEKLDRANAEIAQVRGKAQQEQAAYQASLRKEQLKVDALERTLEQKVLAPLKPRFFRKQAGLTNRWQFPFSPDCDLLGIAQAAKANRIGFNETLMRIMSADTPMSLKEEQEAWKANAEFRKDSYVHTFSAIQPKQKSGPRIFSHHGIPHEMLFSYTQKITEGMDPDVILDCLGFQWELHRMYFFKSQVLSQLLAKAVWDSDLDIAERKAKGKKGIRCYKQRLLAGSKDKEQSIWNERMPKVTIALEISDPDVTRFAFAIALKNLYSSELEVNEDDVLGILATAEVLQFPSLFQKCVQVMRSSICPANVCSYYSAGCKYKQPSLITDCERWIEVNLVAQLGSQIHLRKLPLELLQKVLKSSREKHSQAECYHQKGSPSGHQPAGAASEGQSIRASPSMKQDEAYASRQGRWNNKLHPSSLRSSPRWAHCHSPATFSRCSGQSICCISALQQFVFVLTTAEMSWMNHG